MNITKIKSAVIILITIIFSILYIFIANKYVTLNLPENENIENFDSYRAKVLNIIDILEYEYDYFGEDPVYGKTIVFEALILNGHMKGEIVTCLQDIDPNLHINLLEISVNDVVLISTEFINPDFEHIASWAMLEYSRTNELLILTIAFFVLILLFGRLKGILTIISLILTCLAIFMIFIPAVMSGLDIYFWSIQVCLFIIVTTSIVVNSLNIKTISAMIGCFSGILIAGLITYFMSEILKMTGNISDEVIFIKMINEKKPIDLTALVFSTTIIGAVGAVMDVAISIASALYEIHQQKSNISFKELLKSGFAIGRDIMGTMTNTLILAYIGSSLITILLLVSTSNSYEYLINTERIVQEILQSLIGSIGILLALPTTSIVSSFLYVKSKNKT